MTRAGTPSWHEARNLDASDSAVSPRAASRCANLGRWRVSLNSKSIANDKNICARPPRAAERSRAGGPVQSEPEMIVLGSMTSFTSTPLGSDSVHLGLDFLHSNRFARLSADAIEHCVEFGASFAAAEFGREQVAEGLGLQEAICLRLFHQSVRQIQFDGHAHTGHNIAGTPCCVKPFGLAHHTALMIASRLV